MCLVRLVVVMLHDLVRFFFFQAEDGIRDLVRSRGLGDVYKRQDQREGIRPANREQIREHRQHRRGKGDREVGHPALCLLYTSDAADERSSVDLGGRRIIKKKNRPDTWQNDAFKETNHNLNTTILQSHIR